MRSDKKTTQYMRRFRSNLGEEKIDDVYLNHYCEEAQSTSKSSSILLLDPAATKKSSAVPNDEKKFNQVALSDRNLLCMAAKDSEVVVGGADHAAYVVSIETATPKLIRQLYSKNFGHTEWVTSLCYLADGRIVSGGMDSKICIWAAGDTKCANLIGHVGSVSRVRGGFNCIVSASYDRSIKVWSNSKLLLASLHGHSGAVLDFIFHTTNTLVSVGRDSTVRLWDVCAGKQLAKFDAHRGHVPLIVPFGDKIVATAGQDGCVIQWDLRQRKYTHKIQAFPTSVTNLVTTSTCGLAVSGADGNVAILDNSMTLESQWEGGSSFIYSLIEVGGKILYGEGNGTMTIASIQGQILEKLKIDQNALRDISVSSNGRICTITDDGNFHSNV